MYYGKEMSANVKLNQPCNIGRASPAFVVAYAHCSVDIDRGVPASIVACEHKHIHFRVGCAHRSGEFCHDLRASIRWHKFWYACIGPFTLVVSCAHRPSDIDQLQIQYPRPTHFNLGVCTLNKLHVFGLHELSRWRRQTIGSINHSHHASGVVYAYIESNIGQRYKSSSKDMHA